MILCTLNIEMARNRMNMVQLAEKSGVSRGTISALYHDRAKRIDFETMDKLCKALDCSPGQLFIRTENETENNG